MVAAALAAFAVRRRGATAAAGFVVESNFMHELSIAESIVESVTAALAGYPGAKVREVRLRVGALQSVVPESLEFCWDLAVERTVLAGARLQIAVLPVVVHCSGCGADAELAGVQSFRCPSCGEQCSDVRAGRELEIDSVEIEEDEGAGIRDQGPGI